MIVELNIYRKSNVLTEIFIMFHTSAIIFEYDAYLLSESKVMGRQAVGNSFLSAAVAGRNPPCLENHKKKL
ncbi:MAG: hypothetical protein RL236_1143 [Pseudomonadota bacterium]